MRKLKAIICVSVVVVVAVLCVVATGVLAMNNKLWFQIEGATDAYVFPKYEGEEELLWDDMISFNQVPDDILKAMSTDGLIETCLNYPLFAGGMIFSNKSMYSGFQETCKQFNGLQELLLRENAGNVMLNLYKDSGLDTVLSNDSYPIFRLKYFEYILAQNEILNKLPPEERSELTSVCMERLNTKQTQYADSFYADSTLLILARVYAIDDAKFEEYRYENPQINAFIETGIIEHISDEDVNQFISFMQSYEGGNGQ